MVDEYDANPQIKGADYDDCNQSDLVRVILSAGYLTEKEF
jgi:hypothetical protein